MTVVMTAVVANLIASDPDQGLAMAFTVVILAGCLQILFGILRVGHFVTMMPYTVVSGFMTGIGIILIILQIGPFQATTSKLVVLLELYLPSRPCFRTYRLTKHVWRLGTFLIIALIPSSYRRFLPPQLLALICGSVVASLFLSGEVRVIGTIPDGLPKFQLPVFEMRHWQIMMANALVLAMLGSIDALLTSVIADSMTKRESDANKELIGQGIGNIASGFFGGFLVPVPQWVQSSISNQAVDQRYLGCHVSLFYWSFYYGSVISPP